MIARFRYQTWSIIRFLWPPLGLHEADRSLDETTDSRNQRYEAMVTDFFGRLSVVGTPDQAVSGIEEVFGMEQRRKESVEAKSSTLLGAVGIVVSLVSFASALLGTSRDLPRGLALVFSVIVVAAIVHFLSAVSHALTVSQVGALHLPSAQGVDDFLAEDPAHRPLAFAARKYAYVRLNEPILTKKTNHLFMAQLMYRRGIVLLGIAVIASFLYPHAPRESSQAPKFKLLDQETVGGPFK